MKNEVCKSAANNAGLGETVLLRANEPEFIPSDFLIDDFRILLFSSYFF